MPAVHDLPALNATLNGICTVFLLLGYRFIRRGRIPAHRAAMIAAAATSVLFLTSYLAYHLQTGSTEFQSGGAIRIAYLTILVSHSALAAVVAPLAILTLFRAVKGQFDRHRRLARFTWPVWIYVSITGVVIYLMLYHLDPWLLTRSAT